MDYIDKTSLTVWLMNMTNQLTAQASMATPVDVSNRLYAQAATLRQLFDLVVDGAFDIEMGENLSIN